MQIVFLDAHVNKFMNTTATLDSSNNNMLHSAITDDVLWRYPHALYGIRPCILRAEGRDKSIQMEGNYDKQCEMRKTNCQ